MVLKTLVWLHSEWHLNHVFVELGQINIQGINCYWSCIADIACETIEELLTLILSKILISDFLAVILKAFPKKCVGLPRRIVLNKDNFLSKRFDITLTMYHIAIVKMWSKERFVNCNHCLSLKAWPEFS